MSDVTINCIYCEKTIKLSYKSRHEKSKGCIQARAKGNITIYLCQHCKEPFSDLDLKNKHEKHLKCDQSVLFKMFQISLDEKNVQLNSVNIQLSEKNDELTKKQTEINLLKKQVNMLAKQKQKKHLLINRYNQNEQQKLFKQFNRKTQSYVLCDQQFNLSDVNTHWCAYNIIMHTPCINAGISFKPMYVQQTNNGTLKNDDIKMYLDALMLYNINNIPPRIILYLYQYFNITNPLYNSIDKILGDIKIQYKYDDDDKVYDIDKILGDIKIQYKYDDDDKVYDIDKILYITTNNLTNDYECKRDNYYILTDAIKQMCLKC